MFMYVCMFEGELRTLSHVCVGTRVCMYMYVYVCMCKGEVMGQMCACICMCMYV